MTQPEQEKLDVDTRTTNILSCCSGVGGLELGLRLAIPTARTICFVEHEAFACEVVASRMEDEALDDAPIWSDIRTFDGEPWRGVVDILTAGYPCQPFSVAGKKLGAEDPRHLWPDIQRVIGEVEPTFVFCENVDRHLSAGFDVVASDLQGLGYTVAAGTFSAAEVGAPHLRKRLFFLACLDGGGGWPELADAGREFEHADESRRREREGGEGSAESECSDKELAYCFGERPQRNIEGRSAARSIGLESRELGDTQLSGLEGVIHTQGTEVTHQGHCELAEPKSTGLREGQSWGANGTGEVEPSGQSDRSIFPPRPDELERWARVLSFMPSLEPAVCRVADGTPNRVDRLRALGNGVVPTVAAFAFLTLAESLISTSPSERCHRR